MPAIIKYVQSDFNVSLSFNLQNNDGTPFNLTDCSLVFNCQFGNSSGLKFSGSMVIDDAVNGVCHYTPQTTDFNEWGTYLAQIVVTNGGSGEVLTFPDITVIATQKLPTM
jgi:hypothetical protein